MTEIIPAILPHSLTHIREQFGKILRSARKVQIDIVDGKYAGTKTWPFKDSQFEEMMNIVRGEEKFPLIDDFDIEIDMLVLHPIEYLSDFISLGAKGFVFHIDSTDHLKECIETGLNASCKVGLGIKPSGDLDLLESFILKAEFVQFMGNDRVGYNGVELDPKVLVKIEDFHNRHPSIPIQIDIGVNRETIPILKKVGVSRFVSGSAIFNASDPKKSFRDLQNL